MEKGRQNIQSLLLPLKEMGYVGTLGNVNFGEPEENPICGRRFASCQIRHVYLLSKHGQQVQANSAGISNIKLSPNPPKDGLGDSP